MKGYEFHLQAQKEALRCIQCVSDEVIGVAKPQQTNMLATPPDAFGSAYKSRKRGMQRDSPPSPTCVEKISVWLPVSPFANCLLRRPLVDRSILKMP